MDALDDIRTRTLAAIDAATDPAAEALLQANAERVVWGSDWPHTQHESMTSYADSWRRFESLVSDETDRRCITGETAAQLFQFA